MIMDNFANKFENFDEMDSDQGNAIYQSDSNKQKM